MRIDLHCHSKHSKRPSLWLMQRIGCPESFTEPLELYALALQKGMTAVTITDHNVIDACLEIAHLPNTIMGCEYTTYFPEDRCKVHVLVYGFSEAQHKELDQARENIYHFTAYLREHRIEHICAHPLFGPNDRLSIDHVEKLALLYKNWELNGDQAPAMNDIVQRIVQGLSPEYIARLEEKHQLQARHGIAPCDEAWRKNFTSGSDDHSSLHLAVAYTEVPGAENFEQFWRGVNAGQAGIHCPESSPQSFARNVYGIAYQFYKSKFDLDRHVNKDVLLRFLDRTLHTRPENAPVQWRDRMLMGLSWLRRNRVTSGSGQPSLFAAARQEAERLVRKDPQLLAIVQNGNAHGADLDRVWYDFVNAVSNKVLMDLGEHVLDRIAGGRIFDLFHALGSAGALYALLAPYFVSFSHHRTQRQFSVDVLQAFAGELPSTYAVPGRVAHFTDTFDEVNGVAHTLRQQLAAARALGKDYTIVLCADDLKNQRPGVKAFKSIGAMALPEYPEVRLLVPPLLKVVEFIHDGGFTHLHLATPGPVGLAGLAAAKLLGLPVSGTYHTALPQYAKALTEDSYAEDMMWKLMVWFYGQMDYVYVPSQATGAELIAQGIAAEKIRLYPRGVDTERFTPAKRNGFLATHYAIGHDELSFLYVGRVSKEKNLHVLTEAYQAMLAKGVRARLVITGDGPYRAEMQAALQETPAVFTGYLAGEDLCAVYASSDVLVFPSATDTFGNVVLEAQASGIPVIVTDQGGPAENMLHGETGLRVPANDPAALASAMAALVSDAAYREQMGRTARGYIETRAFEKAFEQLYALYISETLEEHAPVRLEFALPSSAMAKAS